MEVRRLEAGDWDEWLRMRAALGPEFSAETLSTEVEEYRLDETTMAVFVVARLEGGLGGFLEAAIRPFAEGCETRPVGYIEGWYVDPDLRRLGLGGRLVRTAEAWALAQGCREMASDCELDNTVSFQAHLALGYQEALRSIHFKKRLDTRERA